LSHKRTIALDVDAVLARYDGWQGIEHIGEPLPGAVAFSQRLAERYEVLIYTTRCANVLGRQEAPERLKGIVKAWLDKHGFAYHDIWAGQGKPIFFATVDDRAISCRPQDKDGPTAAYAAALGDLLYLEDKDDEAKRATLMRVP
jgi:hypothetical protein